MDRVIQEAEIQLLANNIQNATGVELKVISVNRVQSDYPKWLTPGPYLKTCFAFKTEFSGDVILFFVGVETEESEIEYMLHTEDGFQIFPYDPSCALVEDPNVDWKQVLNGVLCTIYSQNISVEHFATWRHKCIELNRKPEPPTEEVE